MSAAFGRSMAHQPGHGGMLGRPIGIARLTLAFGSRHRDVAVELQKTAREHPGTATAVQQGPMPSRVSPAKGFPGPSFFRA